MGREYERRCPTCGAEPREPCKSAQGHATSIHHARILGVPMNKQNRLRPTKGKRMP